MSEAYLLGENPEEIGAEEFGRLATLAGWGELENFPETRLAEHFGKVAYLAYVREAKGSFVGYVSVLESGMSAAIVDCMLIHPEFDRAAIGRLLVEAVLEKFAGTAVYAMPFTDEQDVFRDAGFRVYRREMIALAHRNAVRVSEAV